MRGGAGTGPGRECAALISDLRVGDSFDMASKRQELGRKTRKGQSSGSEHCCILQVRGQAIHSYLPDR
jgi:hypothetical protein